MKVIDVVCPERINKTPDKTIIVLSSGNFIEQDMVVEKIHLNLYIQKSDKILGTNSLITAWVKTDKGEIEMTYDEGYLGENALESASSFLISHLGLSSLIKRSVLQLKNSIQ